MRWVERVIYLLVIAFTISCAVLPPKKEHVTTLFAINWEAGCIVGNIGTLKIYDNDVRYTITENEGKRYAIRCISETDSLDDITGITPGDFKGELDYQNFLIKESVGWR
jgi:hypothetical protein